MIRRRGRFRVRVRVSPLVRDMFRVRLGLGPCLWLGLEIGLGLGLGLELGLDLGLD